MSETGIALRILFVVSILLIKVSFVLSGAEAQGTLGRVRKAVRHNDQTDERENDKASENSESTKDKSKSNALLRSVVSAVQSNKGNSSRSTPDRRRRKRNRRHGYRANSSHLFLSTAPVCQTPTVVETIHVYESPIVSPAAPAIMPGNELLIDDTSSRMLTPEELVHPGMVEEPGFDDWAFRLTTLFGSNFDQLSQGGFGLLIQPAGSLGLDLSLNTFRERGFAFRDHLWIGDANIVVESDQGRFRGRMGIGLNWLTDPYGSDAGFNLTLGFDHLLGPRWVASGEMDLGTLGATDLFHAQFSIGHRIKNSEIVAGYDYYNIGGVGVDGWFTGFRFRF